MQIEPYEGKYSADPRLPPALVRLDHAVPRSVNILHERLGVDFVLPPSAVCVVDAKLISMTECAEVQVRTVGGETTGVVVLAAEDLISGSSDLESVLVHEFVHLIHASGLGYDAAPIWLREGLARWVESESDDQTERWILSYAVHDSDVHPTPISTLLKSERELADADEHGQSAAGIVFFFALQRLRGRDQVRRLAVRLLRDRDWQSAMEAECGKPFPEVLNEIRGAYAQWTESINSDVVALLDAARRGKLGDYAGAEAALLDLLSERARPSIRPQAERAMWRIQWASGDLEGAKASIYSFRANFQHDVLVTASWFDELEILRQQGRRDEVAVVARRLLQDELWTPEAANDRAFVAKILMESERNSDGR